ncbi:hypothetical protein D3C76_1130830 [compost metagenome]
MGTGHEASRNSCGSNDQTFSVRHEYALHLERRPSVVRVAATLNLACAAIRTATARPWCSLVQRGHLPSSPGRVPTSGLRMLQRWQGIFGRREKGHPAERDWRIAQEPLSEEMAEGSGGRALKMGGSVRCKAARYGLPTNRRCRFSTVRACDFDTSSTAASGTRC